MPFAAVGTRELHYELTGDGPLLVLVMGLGVGGDAWQPLLPLFDGYRTLTFDNAGVGRTRDRETGATPGPPYTTEGFADDLGGLLHALDLGPAHVVGVSMGGAIAMHLAARAPALVETLTLCATWPKADGLLRQVFSFRETLLEGLGPDALLRYVSLFAWGPPSWDEGGAAVAATEGLVGSGAPAWDDDERRRYLGHLRASVEHDATPVLGSIEAPTLVLVGDGDILTPVRFARALAAAIPGAELEIAPDRGHAFPFEAPEEFARRVRAFLAHTD
jgi:pimeloyl-ACP methyl ester carboxylesterase